MLLHTHTIPQHPAPSQPEQSEGGDVNLGGAFQHGTEGSISFNNTSEPSAPTFTEQGEKPFASSLH